MPKVSSFIVALILCSLFAAVVGVFMADINSNYAVSYGTGRGNITTYNKLNELTNLTSDIQDNTENIKQKTGILDVLGGFFSDAYSALKITGKSMDIFNDMSDTAIEQANLGPTANYYKIAIGAIILVIIVVGIFLKAVTKTDV